MKLSLPTKFGGKLVWVPVTSFCKISFPVKHLMAYYAKTGLLSPPTRLTLPITLIYKNRSNERLDKILEVQFHIQF
jgi:hypothetical protein